MNIRWLLFALIPLLSATGIQASDPLLPISSDEAFRKVQAAETLQSEAQKQHIRNLKNAPAEETKIVKRGSHTIIFNRLPSKKEVATPALKPAANQPSALPKENHPRRDAVGTPKQNKQLTLSAKVYPDGVSELCWTQEGGSYRIFTNADCSILRPFATYEDALNRYTTFLAVVSANRDPASETNQTLPKIEDFQLDGVEYWITEWGNKIEPDPRDFAGIDAILTNYAQNQNSLRTAHQNQQQLQAAKDEYRRRNPSMQSETVINFRPLNPDEIK